MLVVHRRQQFSPRFPPGLGTLVLLLALCSKLFSADATADLRTVEELQQRFFSKYAQRSLGEEELAKLARDYEALVEKHIDDPRVHVARARFLSSAGMLREAQKEWETAHKLEPSNDETVHQLAECALALKDIKTALRWLEHAVELRPASALYHFNLGNAYFLFRSDASRVRGKSQSSILTEALEHLQTATELAPQNPEFARGYAETFYGMPNPDWESALRAWQHYAEASGDKEFASANLARIRLKLGQFAKAREALEPLEDNSRVKELLESKIGAAESAQRDKKPDDASGNDK